jgi:hypothetical protein
LQAGSGAFSFDFTVSSLQDPFLFSDFEFKLVMDSPTSKLSSPEQGPQDGWPRRLLYIAGPDLVSLEWQDGNFYRGVKEPEYAVLSYTWGRFEHRGCKDKSHSVIQIGGIPWKPPCICTNHFSADEFTQVIRTLEKEYLVKYLWLDVACIDQRSDSREKYLEIGRQYAIFNRANKAFAWLTTLHQDTYESQRLVPIYGEGALVSIPWVAAKLKILEDRWFESLWTLQEAFICVKTGKDIQFLTRNAQPLTAFLGALDHLDKSKFLKGIHREGELSEKLDSIGLRAILSKNPVALYDAVNNRTASEPVDHIYAIQQVFGFQLGKTDPKRPEDRDRVYSLKDLRDEFGMAFARKYPVGSQFFKFSNRGEDGHSWRMSSTTTLVRNPRFLSALTLVSQFELEDCELDLDKGKLEGLDAMYFSGKVCPAAVFHRQIRDDTCIEPFYSLDDRDCADEVKSRMSQDGDLEDVGNLKLVVLRLGLHKHEIEGLPVSEYGGVILLQRPDIPQMWYRCGFWLWRVWPRPTSSSAFRELVWTDEKGYFY